MEETGSHRGVATSLDDKKRDEIHLDLGMIKRDFARFVMKEERISACDLLRLIFLYEHYLKSGDFLKYDKLHHGSLSTLLDISAKTNVRIMETYKEEIKKLDTSDDSKTTLPDAVYLEILRTFTDPAEETAAEKVHKALDKAIMRTDKVFQQIRGLEDYEKPGFPELLATIVLIDVGYPDTLKDRAQEIWNEVKSREEEDRDDGNTTLNKKTAGFNFLKRWKMEVTENPQLRKKFHHWSDVLKVVRQMPPIKEVSEEDGTASKET